MEAADKKKKAEDAKATKEASDVAAKKKADEEAKAAKSKSSSAKPAPWAKAKVQEEEDPAVAEAKKALEAKVQTLLNQEKALKLQLSCLNGYNEPEVLKAKTALQAELTKCHHERTMLKPVEDRVSAMKQAVQTCEAKVTKAKEVQLEAGKKLRQQLWQWMRLMQSFNQQSLHYLVQSPNFRRRRSCCLKKRRKTWDW